MKIFKCKFCSKNFKDYKYYKRKFCCRKCYESYKKEKGLNYKCDFCNKKIHVTPFDFKIKNHHFCSLKCFGKYKTKNGWLIIKCKYCKKDFKIIKSWVITKNIRFCSHKCYGKYNSGENCCSYKKGKPNCRDCRKKLSNYDTIRCHRCQSKNICGKNHWFWKKGISSKEILERNNKRGRKFRTKIFKRDNYTCIICNQRGKKLTVHHLNAYHWCKSLRFDVFNVVTLCRNCHSKFHKQYGTNWVNINQFIEFLGYNI